MRMVICLSLFLSEHTEHDSGNHMNPAKQGRSFLETIVSRWNGSPGHDGKSNETAELFKPDFSFRNSS